MIRALALSFILCPLAAQAADDPPAKPAGPESRTIKEVAGWRVRVDDRLLAAPHEELGTRSLRFLEAKLEEIKVVLPPNRVQQLQKVTIVLDLECGRLGVMQYHPSADWLKANGYAADLEKCVHIPEAKDLVTARTIREQPWVVLHELAHAFHDQVLDFDEPRIKAAFEAYRASGRGEKTLLYDGRRVKHYALTDHKEFFAEMTESYFGANDFYPFNRAELKESEPELLEVLRKIWSAEEPTEKLQSDAPAKTGAGAKPAAVPDPAIGRTPAGKVNEQPSPPAVRLGLEWLKRQERPRNGWSMVGPYSGGGIENECAATAMAVLAFLGGGNTPTAGEYRDEVARGWQLLAKMQRDDGCFLREGGAPMHQVMYAHALATWAACELVAVTEDDAIRKKAQLAVKFIETAQSTPGGWRYTPKNDADLSVTAWMTGALYVAKKAGLEVNEDVWNKIPQFLNTCTVNEGESYAYQPLRAATPPMTAAGLFCRKCLGWPENDKSLERALLAVDELVIDLDNQNVYHWFFATQAMHRLPARLLPKPTFSLGKAIDEHQVRTGTEKGSWPPQEDRWGPHGGRLYTTCLTLLTLETKQERLMLFR